MTNPDNNGYVVPDFLAIPVNGPRLVKKDPAPDYHEVSEMLGTCVTELMNHLGLVQEAQRLWRERHEDAPEVVRAALWEILDDDREIRSLHGLTEDDAERLYRRSEDFFRYIMGDKKE